MPRHALLQCCCRPHHGGEAAARACRKGPTLTLHLHLHLHLTLTPRRTPCRPVPVPKRRSHPCLPFAGTPELRPAAWAGQRWWTPQAHQSLPRCCPAEVTA